MYLFIPYRASFAQYIEPLASDDHDEHQTCDVQGTAPVKSLT